MTAQPHTMGQQRFISAMAKRSGYDLRQNTDGTWFLVTKATGAASLVGDRRSLDDIAQFLLTETFP